MYNVRARLSASCAQVSGAGDHPIFPVVVPSQRRSLANQENASSIPVSVGRLTWCRGDVALSQAITLPHRLAHGFARNYKYRKCIPYVGLCRTHALDTHTLIIKGFH